MLQPGKQTGDDTPVGRLGNDLKNLVAQWEELGIDPDDFIRCARCHRFWREFTEGMDPPIPEDEYCKCDDD